MPRSPETYTDYRDQQAEISRDRSAKGREIGPLPKVAKPKRKSRCRLSLRFFCETYLAERFPLAWSDDHIKAIERLQTATLEGGRFAFAMPRGSGKTTLSESAALWAILYAHRSFVVLIGSTESAAEEMLESLKVEMEANDVLADDFPEVCYPIRCLEGIANRCNGQTLEGERTRIEWTQKQIVLPTVKGKKTSGTILKVAGITGRIRGTKTTKPDGSICRPDLVLIDDPSTDESAKSLSQNDDRERVIAGAVLGLAGPKRKISAVMPCTVIAPNDLADRVLNRDRHPTWNGERWKFVYAFPANQELWERYADLRREGMRAGDKGKSATEFYAANREAMDAGAAIAWPERFNEDELSAIQGAMNVKIDNPAAFAAEWQNDPIPLSVGPSDSLSTEQILSKLNNVPRGTVPRDCTRVTAFIDIGKELLSFGVAGFDEYFGGAAIDCGAFPGQNRTLYSKSDARPSLSDHFPGCTETARIYQGLSALVPLLLEQEWIQHETGAKLKIDRLLIDIGYQAETVFKWIRESGYSSVVMAAKGHSIRAQHKPMHEWPHKTGQRQGFNFRVYAPESGKGRWVIADTNAWKSFFIERVRVPKGTRGSFAIFGTEADARAGLHQLIVNHWTAETRVTMKHEQSGRMKDEWTQKPNQDNEFFDCFVGCCVAASVHGLQWTPDASPVPKRERRRIDLDELAKRGAELPAL